MVEASLHQFAFSCSGDPFWIKHEALGMNNDTNSIRTISGSLKNPLKYHDFDVSLGHASLPDHVLQEAWSFFIAAQARKLDVLTAGRPTKTQDDSDTHTHHEAGQHDHGAGHHEPSAPHDFPAPHRGTLGGLNVPEGSGVKTGAAAVGPQSAIIESGVNAALVPSEGVGVALGDTFRLHSLPSSTYKIFLDFDGHTTTGTSWNSYWGTSSISSPAFSLDGSESFNATELLYVQQIWQQVAEYFSPFNIDVTTEDPGTAGLSYSGAGDKAFGIRVVITDEGGKSIGGTGWVGSFDWNSDTPVFVYANPLGDNIKQISVAAAHEIGHSLGLDHDGQGGSDYYYGHTGWAPVMGVGYDAGIVQWSNGGYSGATNTQDDLGIITTQNSGVGYRADDFGNTFASAATLAGTLANGVISVKSFGIISGSGNTNDTDMFRFDLAQGGSVNLSVSSWTQAWVTGNTAPVYDASPFSMLDVALSLYDSSFKTVATWNDVGRLDGVLNLSNLAGGTYFLAVDGTGWGTPTGSPPTGYSDYGSLGQYMITGTYTAGGGGGTIALPVLEVSRNALITSEAGGSDSLTLRAVNATGDVLVSVGGLDASEGKLSASSLLLNAANNWTATLGVTGINDRDADGSVTYNLALAAAGFDTLAVKVTNTDNDIAPTSGGSSGSSGGASGGGKKGSAKALVQNATVAELAADDGVSATLTEAGRRSGFNLEWRWEFTGLTGGDHRLQVDASSNGEAFRLQYSTDGAATWKAFDGAPASAATWFGDYLATGVGSSLWVRLVDTDQSSADTVKSSFAMDLLTLTPSSPGAISDIVLT